MICCRRLGYSFIAFFGIVFLGTNPNFSRDRTIRFYSLVAQKIGLCEGFKDWASENFFALGQIFRFFNYFWLFFFCYFLGTNSNFSRDRSIRFYSLVAQNIGLREGFNVWASENFFEFDSNFRFFAFF